MGNHDYAYMKEYRERAGIVRIPLHMPKAVKEEIQEKARADGQSVTDWILSRLDLTTYQPKKKS